MCKENVWIRKQDASEKKVTLSTTPHMQTCFNNFSNSGIYPKNFILLAFICHPWSPLLSPGWQRDPSSELQPSGCKKISLISRRHAPLSSVWQSDEAHTIAYTAEQRQFTSHSAAGDTQQIPHTEYRFILSWCWLLVSCMLENRVALITFYSRLMHGNFLQITHSQPTCYIKHIRYDG